ncbi:pyrroloquinoline-quinone synthase [Palleronia marisminoris]|uniref:Pyrroloquinoline quinone biosynthesis protein PqqC n=1 Tax=Palleronia marisminoris TaxID=315423 RepID=A0A1Y5SCQ2_9RHOB|nr:pyrroloquinoline-quinone synthase [Palleronia marisminoris]SLN36622.1 pyrroloquinoline quinone biosynthesis protein PqqC [Palleronia marisminoris]
MNRLKEAPKDAAFGLGWVLDHADTVEKQDALVFKTDVLWSQLGGLHAARPHPPGAWQPGTRLADAKAA